MALNIRKCPCASSSVNFENPKKDIFVILHKFDICSRGKEKHLLTLNTYSKWTENGSERKPCMFRGINMENLDASVIFQLYLLVPPRVEYLKV